MHGRMALALAAAGATLIGAAAFASPDHVTEDAAKVEALWLGDKTPGKPRNCIMASQIRGSRSIGERTILYRVSGNLIYRNDPPGGCPGLREETALILQTPQNQLCKGDVMIVQDLRTGFAGGGCALGAFVPYTKR